MAEAEDPMALVRWRSRGLASVGECRSSYPPRHGLLREETEAQGWRRRQRRVVAILWKRGGEGYDREKQQKPHCTMDTSPSPPPKLPDVVRAATAISRIEECSSLVPIL